MIIIARRKRAVTVFGRLLERYAERGYPFNLPKVRPPQIPENLPKNLRLGTREHALFLFVSCYWMRGGIESDTAFRALARIYEAAPRLFLPEHVDEFKPRHIRRVLERYGLGFQSQEISRFWVLNHQRLRDQWWSNPIELFRGVRTYEEACRRIQNNGKKGRRHRGFYGFQEKMVSMIIYFLMEAGFVDRFNFPVPVDFHALRVVFAHRLIEVRHKEGEMNGDGFYIEPVLEKVRELAAWYCKAHRVDPIDLCTAMWLLSRSLCGETPGNDSLLVERNGRKSLIEPVPISWTEAQTATYERTCGLCPLEGSCHFNVPSMNYYVLGKLAIRGERIRPPVWNPLLL